MLKHWRKKIFNNLIGQTTQYEERKVKGILESKFRHDVGTWQEDTGKEDVCL